MEFGDEERRVSRHEESRDPGMGQKREVRHFQSRKNCKGKHISLEPVVGGNLK